MMRHRLLHILAGILLVAGTSPIRGAEPAPPRVVVVGIGDARLSHIRELTEITLAQAGRVRLLDRQEIDPVLAEQGLSASGLIDAEHAVKVGHLLSADLLAIIDSAPQASEAGLVIFDARTGVRLADRAIVIAEGEKAATAVSEAVLSAVVERDPEHKPMTVCLATIRNADLPHELDGLCDAMGRMLERNLLASGSIAVLERSRLDEVTRERALAADPAADAILGSVVMVDLEISGVGPGLQAVVLLTDSAGKKARKLTARVPDRDGAELVRRLSEGVAKALAMPALPAFDASAEGSRFCREAMFRGSHGDWARAIAPAEAAVALDPRSARNESVLVEALINWGNDTYAAATFGPRPLLKPMPPGAMPALVRGSQLLVQASRLAHSPDADQKPEAQHHLTQAASVLRDFLMHEDLARQHPAATYPLTPGSQAISPEVLAAKDGLRRLLHEIRDARAAIATASTTDGAFGAYSRTVASYVDMTEWATSRSAEEWTTDQQQLAEQWWTLHEKFPLPVSRDVLEAVEALTAGWAMEKHPKMHPCRWELSPEDTQRLAWIGKKLSQDSNPLFREYGDLCQLSLDVVSAAPSADKVAELVGAFLERVKKKSHEPQYVGSPTARIVYYRLLLVGAQLLEKTPAVGTTCDDLLNHMLAEKEVHPPTVQWILDGFESPLRKPENVQTRKQAIEKLLVVLDSPDSVVLIGSKAELRSYYHDMFTHMQKPENPRPGYVLSKPWRDARTLISLRDVNAGLQWLFRPIEADGVIYVAGVAEERLRGPETIQLLRFPMAGGELPRSISLPVHFGLQREAKLKRWGTTMLGGDTACIGAGAYFFGTKKDGILTFPLDGSAPRALDEHAGLPSHSVQSLGVMDGQLYAGLGDPENDGYLIAYDLQKHSIDVLASTQRKEKRSPFDDIAPVKFIRVTVDPARRRLIVAVQCNLTNPVVDGLWELKPATRTWRRLVAMRLDPNVNVLKAVGRPFHDQLPIITSQGVYSFDLAHDQIFWLFRWPRMVTPIMTEEVLRLPGEVDLAEKALADRQYAGFDVWTFSDEWVWAAFGKQPWGRTNLATGVSEFFASPRADSTPFSPHTLQVLDDGKHVLAADEDEIFLLTMDPPSLPVR